MYWAFAVAVLATPFVLRLGTDVSELLQRTQAWFLGCFVACCLVSLMIARTYAVWVCAIEILRTRAMREGEWSCRITSPRNRCPP
jgi:hypothetical protein